MDSIKNKLRGLLKFMARKKFNEEQWKTEANLDFSNIENIEQFSKLVETYNMPWEISIKKDIKKVVSNIIKNSNQDLLKVIFSQFVEDGKTRDIVTFILDVFGVDEMFVYINVFLNIKLNQLSAEMTSEFNSEINKLNSTLNAERLNLSNQISALNTEIGEQRDKNNKLLAELNSMIEVVKDYQKLQKSYENLSKLYKESTDKLKEFDKFKDVMKQIIS